MGQNQYRNLLRSLSPCYLRHLLYWFQRNKTELQNFYGVHSNQPAIPENLVFPLKTTNFSGYQLSVPNQITEMLKFRYPLSGPSVVVSYKWRCYLKTIATLGFRPRRCPPPSQNMATVSEALANITKTSPRKISWHRFCCLLPGLLFSPLFALYSKHDHSFVELIIIPNFSLPSHKVHYWLINNRSAGVYITDYDTFGELLCING